MANYLSFSGDSNDDHNSDLGPDDETPDDEAPVPVTNPENLAIGHRPSRGWGLSKKDKQAARLATRRELKQVRNKIKSQAKRKIKRQAQRITDAVSKLALTPVPANLTPIARTDASIGYGVSALNISRPSNPLITITTPTVLVPSAPSINTGLAGKGLAGKGLAEDNDVTSKTCSSSRLPATGLARSGFVDNSAGAFSADPAQSSDKYAFIRLHPNRLVPPTRAPSHTPQQAKPTSTLPFRATPMKSERSSASGMNG